MTPIKNCVNHAHCGNAAEYAVSYWHFDGQQMEGYYCRTCGENLGRAGAQILRVTPLDEPGPCALHRERGGD